MTHQWRALPGARGLWTATSDAGLAHGAPFRVKSEQVPQLASWPLKRWLNSNQADLSTWVTANTELCKVKGRESGRPPAPPMTAHHAAFPGARRGWPCGKWPRHPQSGFVLLSSFTISNFYIFPITNHWKRPFMVIPLIPVKARWFWPRAPSTIWKVWVFKNLQCFKYFIRKMIMTTSKYLAYVLCGDFFQNESINHCT